MVSSVIGTVMMLAITVSMLGAVVMTAVQLAQAVDHMAKVHACAIMSLPREASPGAPVPAWCTPYLGERVVGP